MKMWIFLCELFSSALITEDAVYHFIQSELIEAQYENVDFLCELSALVSSDNGRGLLLYKANAPFDILISGQSSQMLRI